MYLSKLLLNERSPYARRDLASAYEMHRTLTRAFTGATDSDVEGRAAMVAARLLFRVETDGNRRGIAVLAQSRTEPNWESIRPGGSYFIATPEIKLFNPVLRPDQRLAFRLRANPSVKRRGKRYGLYRTEDHLAWLMRKGIQSGFVVESVIPRVEQRAQHSAHRDGNVEHLAVRFDGILRVGEVARFSVALVGGIGSAKGFGFGLLSIAPANG